MPPQCTCVTDKEMVCIVHPTPRSLKEYIARLEAENALLVDKPANLIIAELEAERAKDREAMQTVVEKALRHDHLQGPVEEAIDNMANRLEER